MTGHTIRMTRSTTSTGREEYMINKETYKNELLRMWDENRSAQYKGYKGCLGVDCTKCPIRKCCSSYGDSIVKAYNVFEIIDEVEKWSKEHQKKKYKISRIEYEILYSVINSIIYANWTFGDSWITCHLLEKGYFKGANEEMKIVDYFNNCEVIKNGQD